MLDKNGVDALHGLHERPLKNTTNACLLSGNAHYLTTLTPYISACPQGFCSGAVAYSG